ncbi:MAG: CPBP family intramembrane metalloprotease [Lachnospiraceae bacterium]|nr:CPBP family intramembrane metalloprotease [Lachnospiraceae bacterium]
MHDTQKTTLQYVADVCFPIALYYVVSNIALYVINFIVQYVAERFFADGTAWVIRNAAALQVADNAAAMCLGFFCVRRAFLSETAAGGEPVLVAPRRVAAGWLLEGAQKRKKDWFWYIPLLLSGTGAALALNFLAGIIQAASRDAAYVQVAKTQYAVPLLLGLIAYGIVSPIVEEGVFRGILYLKCRRYFGRRLPAALLSALLFGILHGNMVQGVYGFVMGMIMIWFYERYDSFLAPVIVHAASNISVFLISFANGGRFDGSSGGSVGDDGAFGSTSTTVIWCVVCAAVSVFSALFIVKWKKRTAAEEKS